MTKQSSEPNTAGHSRRSFLTKLGIGAAVLGVVSTGIIKFGRKRSAEASDEFPGEDSIFHPAQDPRTDPRRG